ncbi:hypothetical protein SKAU_G00300470 [Synaphobranchus kaupii]|uniref:Uncharacterized protein n=1 Tax=Synaphobranchus kaupii TaxID=118154 RepID=A0A9Q1IMZ5_SYNKA|nr:hypothetical protein SKAU_G00300470 [Synaphobranchus kaupii]
METHSLPVVLSSGLPLSLLISQMITQLPYCAGRFIRVNTPPLTTLSRAPPLSLSTLGCACPRFGSSPGYPHPSPLHRGAGHRGQSFVGRRLHQPLGEVGYDGRPRTSNQTDSASQTGGRSNDSEPGETGVKLGCSGVVMGVQRAIAQAFPQPAPPPPVTLSERAYGRQSFGGTLARAWHSGKWPHGLEENPKLHRNSGAAACLNPLPNEREMEPAIDPLRRVSALCPSVLQVTGGPQDPGPPTERLNKHGAFSSCSSEFPGRASGDPRRRSRIKAGLGPRSAGSVSLSSVLRCFISILGRALWSLAMFRRCGGSAYKCPHGTQPFSSGSKDQSQRSMCDRRAARMLMNSFRWENFPVLPGAAYSEGSLVRSENRQASPVCHRLSLLFMELIQQ